MRIRAFLSVYGEEPAIRALAEQTKVDGAVIKQHTKVAPAQSATGKAMPWSWKTPRSPISSDDPDTDLQGLLKRYSNLLPHIRKCRQSDADVALVVLTQFEKPDELCGFYLSPLTISLLHEFEAALDWDIVTILKDNHLD